MKALRSSTIKMLCTQTSNVLYDKISIGEDQAQLSSVYFERALSQSGLIPKAKQTKWCGDIESSLYDFNETNVPKAMANSRKNIVQFLNSCYEITDKLMDDDTKAMFLLSNRATYPFVTLSGLLHTYLFQLGEISATSTIKERVAKITPYIETLCDGLIHISDEKANNLKGIQGQGAEKKWLLAYQEIINKTYPDYNPKELQDWKEMCDQSIQKQGEKCKEEIRRCLKKLVFVKLEEVYGKDYSKHTAKLKHECEGKILKTYGENADFSLDEYDWTDWIEVSEYKELIDKNYSYATFAETFGIPLPNKGTSKKDKLSWMALVEPQKGKKKTGMTQSDVSRLWLIQNHLAQYLPIEE